MAINYVEKHAEKIDELFTVASITEQAVNQDYDFVGAKTIHVHSVPTVAMNDYGRSGSNRYGTPEELEDADQELTLKRDRAFTFTIDKMNSEEDRALNAGKAIKRQMEQVIVPEIDKYRLATIASKAKHRKYGATTTSNAYDALLEIGALVDDEGTPAAGRLAYVSSGYYRKLKQDSAFIKSSDLAQEKLINGQIGEVDGVAIVKGMGRLPAGVDILLCHSVATVAPRKLSEYKIHQDPPGISGELAEGREYYDAFVLDNKKGALAVRYGSLIDLTVTNAAGASGKTKFTAVSGHKETGVTMGTLVYLIAAAPTAPALGADISNTTNYPELTLNTDLTAASGNKYIIALKDADGKCIGTSGAAKACTIG